MPQLFTNNASALLAGAILSTDTSLTVEAARADLFPVGNTTNFATPLNWFKVTMEDSSGNIEIVRVGVRASASAVMSTIQRGQDGTVARAYAAGAVVELRVTAADITEKAALGANIDITSLGNNTSTVYATAGTATAYAITPNPAITAYLAGQSFYVNFSLVSGAAPTLQINGVAIPPNLVKLNSAGAYVNLHAADLPAGHRSRVTLISGSQALVEYVPIKRDSNANGEFVRFPDGTQICTVRATSTTQAFALYISPIHISSYTWTFPAGFIAAPVVNCSEFRWGTSASWGGTAGTATTTDVVLRGYDGAPNATGTATVISATAVGRWY